MGLCAAPRECTLLILRVYTLLGVSRGYLYCHDNAEGKEDSRSWFVSFALRLPRPVGRTFIIVFYIRDGPYRDLYLNLNIFWCALWSDFPESKAIQFEVVQGIDSRFFVSMKSLIITHQSSVPNNLLLFFTAPLVIFLRHLFRSLIGVPCTSQNGSLLSPTRDLRYSLAKKIDVKRQRIPFPNDYMSLWLLLLGEL